MKIFSCDMSVQPYQFEPTKKKTFQSLQMNNIAPMTAGKTFLITMLVLLIMKGLKIK